ncbi:hypothetical protein INT47_012743 [Mucor saturninus]|uniref:Heat shock protein 70 n=1 Tax=Mucor saturninus TaxID=64648 RepID=A0A8H7V1L1_9FUNG|nr:hypothetical protein INT47_012743 [Mucor saturninus]
MANLNQIEYIVGIDLGATTSGVSIAHVNDPFNIITVLSWDDSKEPSKTFFSSILYSMDGNSSPKCGMQHDDVDDIGVYLDNISQYLFDIDASDEKLGQLMDGLTVRKVVTDYLKYFAQLALKRLQVHDRLIKGEHFQEFANEEFFDEGIKTACYCLVCPTDRQEFMKDCFIEAGIIEESEAEHRLSFVIKAAAIAHYQLSRDRNETKIQSGQDYFVLDVSGISVGIAKIHAASTESLSTVTGISDDITLGSINVEIKFKEYLIKNMTELNLDTSLINQFVQIISEKMKYEFNMDTPTETAISQEDVDGNLIEFTYEDLNRIVLKPFIESIAEFVSKAYETHGHYKIFLFGNYGIDAYFVKNLLDRDNGKWKCYDSIVEDSLEMVSSGAVSSILNNYKSQMPFSLNGQHRSLFSDENLFLPEAVSEKFTDGNNGSDAYDFVVGIDFSTTFSGCSYVELNRKDIRTMDIKEIKTFKGIWPGGNLNEFGNAPTLLMYDKNMRLKYWGEEAKLQDKRYKDLNFLGNFKLFLYPESSKNFHGHANDPEELKEQGGINDDGTLENKFDAVRAIADYLKRFKRHIIEHIVTKEIDPYNFSNGVNYLKKYKIRYVITVPAIWNSSARDIMTQAAIEAAIIKKDEANQLLIISEPEAALMFCEKRCTEKFKKEEEEMTDTNFIVCDAGKRTVDLVTVNLQLNGQEGTKPMICQIGDGVGDTCGSSCLDLRFKEYIYSFYETFGYKVDDTVLDSVAQDFVENYKLDFMPNLQGDSFYDIKLSEKEKIIFSNTSPYRLVNGNKTLIMKNQDMKEKIFDPVVDRIISLIDYQLNQAKKVDRRIDSILMVGGFSQSTYLQQRIRNQYKGVCHVRVPFEGVTAISHRSISYASYPHIISKKLTRQSLGLEIQATFIDSSTSLEERKTEGPDRDRLFKTGRLDYFVTMGQELEYERSGLYKKDVYVLYPNAAVIVNLQIEHIGASVTIECQDQLINAEVQKITNNQRSSLKINLKCSPGVAICNDLTHLLINRHRDIVSDTLASSTLH